MKSIELSENLQSELDEVSQLLNRLPSELDSPLHDLVLTKLESLKPHLRALFVLAAGTHEQEPQDSKSKRVYLAAALETLYLALNIHKYLLEGDSASHDHYQNKSYVGGMILAGDYCFSRSAEFAALTDSPSVVSIFSEALGTVSEGHLRHLHEDNIQQSLKQRTPDSTEAVERIGTPYNESFDLLEAGTAAAIELCEMPSNHSDSVIHVSKLVADLCLRNEGTKTPNFQQATTDEDPPQPQLLKNPNSITNKHSTNLLLALQNLPHTQQSRWQTIIDLSSSQV